MSDETNHIPENLTPALPTLSDKLSTLLGFQIPTIPLPQTARNLDKAVSRLLLAGSDNLTGRFERGTLIRQAKTSADLRLIEEASKRLPNRLETNSNLAERALEFSLSESILRQTNREEIARLAITDLHEKCPNQTTDAPTEIDDDWLNEYSHLSEKKGSADIQMLWARILSGKIRNPQSFSLRSLHLLSMIDTRDGNIIHKALSYTISSNFIFTSPNFKDINIFIECEDNNVLSGTSGFLHTNYKIPAAPAPILFKMSGTFLTITSPTERELDIPCYPLSRFGIELLSLSAAFERNIDYENDFIIFLKANGITNVTRTLLKSDGTIDPSSIREV
ncbi:DUF2806 domain-containing protein [Methylosinus sp. RM1]|uniref:DUF2806 domain-containing protein n=1 Tax=Methylosinus sp. RM1 TaxID=2583817 RepID=UPI0014082DBE|nr:DUF2806 domain-containing protein [Methylosinus sp. RM1]